MHLFFTNVLTHLLAHDSPLYEQYYSIRHLFPPYSLYYYLLIALSRLVPIIWADKIVVAMAVANLAFGLRYLCMARSRNGAVVSMLVFPVLLNWPLFMGFVNFTLSLGMAAWAIGIWTRLEFLPPALPRAGMRVSFAALLIAMTMTHPVPFGLVVVFCAGDLAMRRVDLWRQRRLTDVQVCWQRNWSYDLLLLAATTLGCALYISAFTVKHIAQQTQPVPSKRTSVHWLLYGHGLLVMGGHQPDILFYRISVFLVLVLALLLAGMQIMRQRRTGFVPLPRWLIFTVIMIIAMPVIPPDLNASHLFRDRLMIVIWIAAVAAASSSTVLTRRWERILVVYSAVAAVVVLAVISTKVRPVAARVAEIEHVPLGHHGPVGLVLPAALQSFKFQLFFDPYQWAGAHFPRRANGVLLNTPWLDLPIIPLGAQPGHLLTGRMIPMDIEVYSILREDLLTSPAIRQLVYPQTDYAILIDETGRTPDTPVDPVLRADAHDNWHCTTEDWFLICDREPK